MPDGMQTHWIDDRSGYLTGEGCPNSRMLPFIIGSEPRQRTNCAPRGRPVSRIGSSHCLGEITDGAERVFPRGGGMWLVLLWPPVPPTARRDTAPAPVEKPPPTTSGAAPVTPPPRTGAAPPHPSLRQCAWQPLLAKAEQATARGDYEQALALLERAQRIDPDSAEIYLQLARPTRPEVMWPRRARPPDGACCTVRGCRV